MCSTGTPEYIAPEIVMAMKSIVNQGYDEAVDCATTASRCTGIYSLCAVAFLLLMAGP